MDAEKLEALGGLIEGVDGEAPAAQAEQAQQAQAVDAAEEGARSWGVMAYTLGSALSMLAPELRAVYTEDACLAWGRSMMPVADKYGWNGPANVPELGLLIASMSLGVPSFFAVRERLRQIAEAKQLADLAAKAKAEGRTVEAG